MHLSCFWIPDGSDTRRNGFGLRRSRRIIHTAVALCRGSIYKRYGLIGTAAQLPEAAQTTYTVVLQADTNLKDKTVDRSLHLRDAARHQQRTQHAVIVLDKVREEHRLTRDLHYEGTQIGHNQTLVRFEIFRYKFYYHLNKYKSA